MQTHPKTSISASMSLNAILFLLPLRAQDYRSHQPGESTHQYRTQGGNLRNSEQTLPSAPHKLRQRKKSPRQDTLPEFSASPLPLPTGGIWKHPAAIPRPLASSRKAQCDNKVHHKAQTSTSAGSNPQKRVPKSTQTRQHFQEHPATEWATLALPLASSLSPAQLLWLSTRHPSSAGWGTAPSQVHPPPRASNLTLRRGESLPPALGSPAARGVQRWRARTSSVIISAERLLLWIVYIL